MKLKTPSRNIRYSFVMVVLLIGLIFGFAMLAGAITYKLTDAADNTKTLKSEKFDTAAPAALITQKTESQSGSSGSTDTTNIQNTESPQVTQPAAASTIVGPTVSANHSAHCSSLESKSADALKQANADAYATHTQAKKGVPPFLLDSVKSKQVDASYANYHARISALYKDAAATLQSAGCSSRNVVLTLYPK